MDLRTMTVLAATITGERPARPERVAHAIGAVVAVAGCF
jgi:hypothetical protein